MGECETYEVIKFTEHGSKCYQGTDCIRGQTLMRWLKFHPVIAKETLFGVLKSTVRQLELYYKSKRGHVYRYVNPYAVIVSEEGNVYLPDLSAKSSSEIKRFMQRRDIRTYFCCGELQSKESIAGDIYGMGRTMQYVLSQCEPDPPLSGAEEHRLLRIIQKCLEVNSKKQYQSFIQILKDFPKTKQYKRRPLLWIAAVIVSVCVVLLFVYFKNVRAEEEILTVPQDPVPVTETSGQYEADEYMEMGFAYFLDVQDYERSRESFEKAAQKNKAAGNYVKLSEYMLGRQGSEYDLETLLKEIERQIPADNRFCYYFSLVKGYALQHTEQARKEMIRLGEICIDENIEREKAAGPNAEKELRSMLAAAYEAEGKNVQALKQYVALKETEMSVEDTERTYQKLLELYEKEGQKEQAGTCCREGIQKLPASEKLRIAYIGLICRDSGTDGKECSKEIQKCLKELPSLLQNTEFQKLQREYRIQVKGEEVWVEK